MHDVSTRTRLPRRDFLKLAGAGAAALAVPNRSWAGFWGEPAGRPPEFGGLAGTHDLPGLPDWGPYSKKHFGISHIPDVRRGLSFDFSIFPVLANSPVKAPSVTDPSGVHPWEASPDLDFYSLRFETIWKDQLYCDLSFARLSGHSRLVRMEVVNQTGVSREIALHALAQLVFPPVKELTAEPIRLWAARLPGGALWVHALDYADLRFAASRPADDLVAEGYWRGEERRQDCVGGSVLAQGFGRNAGDSVVFRPHLERPCSNAVLTWRFQMPAGESVSFRVSGAVACEVTFRGSGKFDTVSMPLGPLRAGECELCFTSAGGAPVALNGFVLAEATASGQTRFVPDPWHPAPRNEVLAPAKGMILRYEDAPECYGFSMGLPVVEQRMLKWREFDAVFGCESGPNTRERILGDSRRGRAGDPDSLFVHVSFQPFTVEPRCRRVLYGVVCAGPSGQVRRCLGGFEPLSPDNERAYRSGRKRIWRPTCTPPGEPFRFSQGLMAVATLSNVVYPLYTQRNYIRHYSPGRSWDCLYTWDAGFMGLGLAELDVQRAVEILNAYTTAPGAQSAFIHHGSPVPTQIYLFHELWNRTQSRDLLEYFYPRLRQYHRFLAGRLGSSTTRRHQDHLLCTWDYFYNSGGWDDYPPQKFVHQQKMESAVAPVINSSHAIRCARLLRLAAVELGRDEDFAEYDRDIAELSASLLKYSWDPASGYFGYVLHNGAGEPTGILRDGSGANFNMGLDGVYPIMAGICSREQQERILEHLFSPRHLWMDIGITTVDQSAPYFSPDGYWNGSVWYAHQWFLWKAMLDLDRPDLANRIAQTGLELWKSVADSTYDCMEHFKPSAPQGRGWHQFTSLSSPVLPWFASLYTSGRLTCGFDAWLSACRFSRDNHRLRATLKSAGDFGRPFAVLACMNPDSKYQVLWNGAPAPFSQPHDGLLQIHLHREWAPGELRVERI
jgi:hypothetical protein